MFDEDLTLLSTADLMESAAEYRAVSNRADARGLEHALVYADRFHPDTCTPRPGRRSFEGRERAVVLGGDGCPEIADFAISEYAAVLGVSTGVAAKIIGEAMALRHRFPFTWARVLSGEATPWKACRIVRDCMALSEEAAQYVDSRIAALIDTITPYRLDKIVKAAKMHIDPDAARAEAAAKVRERGVFVGRSDEHGTKTIYIRTSSGAAIRFNATIHALSDAQQAIGDTRPAQTRCADAVGIIADPIFAQELLTQAQNHPTPSPTANTPASPTPASPTPAPPTPASASASAPPTPEPDVPAPATPTAHAAAPAAPAPESPALDAATPTMHARRTVAPEATVSADATSTSDVPAASAATPEAAALGCPSLSAAVSNGAVQEASTAGSMPEPTVLGSAVPPAESPPSAVQREDAGVLDDWDEHSACVDEPGPDDEADRDASHPSSNDLPDPLDRPDRRAGWSVESFDAASCRGPDDGEPMDTAAQRALAARLAQIKHDAYARLASGQTPGTTARPAKTEIYVHLTDQTLAAGDGVMRVEGTGPLLLSQLGELIGYGPYIVKPVIDLNEAVSVNCYEATERIRERVKLTHPVELFPYGTRETSGSLDLDHLDAYDPLGPPGQTSTTNLAPLGRYGHRVKTHARGWKVRRISATTLEWTTPHGFVFHVDPTGTHRITTPAEAPSED